LPNVEGLKTMAQIKADEITKLIREQIENY